HNMSVVTRGGYLSCADCGKSFKTTWGQGPHLCHELDSTEHEDKPICLDTGVECPECGKKVRTPQSLEDHMRTHTGDRPFEYSCSECGKEFGLKNHQRTHTGERPYKCTECDKSFTQSGDLVKHKRIHSGEKPFECPECHRCYTSSGDLGKHRRSHTNLRPYTCQECGKSFRLSGHLKTHMLTHTGEKPYSSACLSECLCVNKVELSQFM
uniref:C2H2-type domain-containing protein n=1 Tax=Oreochromis niloticus TaxID=8128 RepID=A0A669DL98_ORENI